MLRYVKKFRFIIKFVKVQSIIFLEFASLARI